MAGDERYEMPVTNEEQRLLLAFRTLSPEVRRVIVSNMENTRHRKFPELEYGGSNAA